VESITKEEFFQADEAFFSGTAVEIAPIVKITDGSNGEAAEKTYTIGSGQLGEVTQKVQNIFHRTVRGELEKYNHWLTYVNEHE
jgi:branched-chain amino acid aminotransferase